MDKEKRVTYMKHTAFVTSPRAEEILDLVKQWQKGKMMINGKKVNKKMLYEKVKQLDNHLPTYTVFCKFVKDLQQDQQKRVNTVLNDLKNQLVKEGETGQMTVLKQLLEVIYSKLFIAGNIAMTQEIEYIKQKVDQGEDLTVKERERIMNLFFKGVDAFNKQRMIDVKIEENDRESTLFDILLDAAHYQKLEKKDVVDMPVEKIAGGADA